MCVHTYNIILYIHTYCICVYVSQASRDPSSRKGQVKSNKLTCAARHNGCVPNQIAGKVEMFITRVSANGSRPEHGPESVIGCDGCHPAPWLFYHEARATSGHVWHRFWKGCFRCFADWLQQEPVLRVPADSVRSGVAGRRDIDSLCCRSFDGYYERSGKCREPLRVLAATSEA